MPLSPEAADRAADLLIAARRAVDPLAELPLDVRPATAEEGYAIQDRFLARWPGPVTGWKVGATAKPVQEKFGVSEPFAGPVFAGDTFASPARVAASAYLHRAIECEFAFRFGARLAPRSGGYTREEIRAAIDAVVPAIEIVGPRFEDLLFARAPTAIADCGVNAGIVLGAPVSDWRGIDFARHPVQLTVDGKVAAEGTGAAVLGDPFNVLDWLVAHLSARGIAIEAGQIVSTGTTTGIAYPPTGSDAVADFGRLGQVALRFVG
jgi:2-keto-4-pentenoate hydratase